MATNSIVIKDGNGFIKSLAANSGSYGFIPEHAVSGTVIVSASAANPVYVTGAVSISQPVNVDVVVGDSISISSSNSNPIWVVQSKASTSAKDKISVGYGIDYSNSTSGTFQIAAQSDTRKGLIVFNPSPSDLYINLGSGSTNGFTLLDGTASAPTSYSFVVYPSGTYIAEDALIGMFHAGFFISSSALTASVLITRIE